MPERYASFRDFYEVYLRQHTSVACRRLHFVGSLLVLVMLVYVLWSQNWWWLLSLPVLGYSFSWIGHAAFEKNQPATFRAPLYSLLADWVMFKDMLTGRLRL